MWEQRFKSIVVEGNGLLIQTIAAYIDLNPVRAGIVTDPKDYRYSGYGEAMGGSTTAREGLKLVIDCFGGTGWGATARTYRKYLFDRGKAKGLRDDGTPLRRGFSPERVQAVLDSDGRLPIPEILRCRVRYFTDGVALGSQEFVEEIFGRYRNQFGLKRKIGARPMKYAQWNGLCTLRNLPSAVMIPTG